MTLIIGIKCKDGVVIAGDGAATYGVSLGPKTIRQQTVRKLSIMGNCAILGMSGPVGLAQDCLGELTKLIEGKTTVANWSTVGYPNISQAKLDIKQKLWQHVKEYWERAGVVAQTIGNLAHQEVSHSTLVAFPAGGEPRLMQFTMQCNGEEMTEALPFVAIGAGQVEADLFLAFARRVFWSDGLPTVEQGVFAAIWTLQHSILEATSGITEPIQAIVLEKTAEPGFIARELSDDDVGETRQMIERLEQGMPDLAQKTISETDAPELPPSPEA